MLPLSSTKRTIIADALVLLIALGGVGFFYYQISKTIQREQELQNDLAFEQQRQQQLQSIRHLVKDTQSQRATLQRYFIPEEGVAGYIDTVERLAKTAEVPLDITSVGVQPYSQGQKSANTQSGVIDESGQNAANNEDQQQNPSLEKVILQLSVRESTWGDMYHFMRLLEELPRSQQLVDVSVSYNQASEVSGWNGQFVVHALKLASDTSNNESS